MNNHLRWIVSSALVAMCFVVSTAHSQESPLVGAWRYVGEVDTREDGSPGPVEALSDSDGLLIYTADGFMSVNIMPKGRKWSAESATADELRETILNGAAYTGRYRVDSEINMVTHVRDVSLDPEGSIELVRSYRLDQDKLVLSGTFPYKGEIIHFAITWERVR